MALEHLKLYLTSLTTGEVQFKYMVSYHFSQTKQKAKSSTHCVVKDM